MPTAWALRRRRWFVKDDRPDWRDPDMKVYDVVLCNDGKKRPAWLTPEMRQKFSQESLDGYMVGEKIPLWRDDPTYDLRVRLKERLTDSD